MRNSVSTGYGNISMGYCQKLFCVKKKRAYYMCVCVCGRGQGGGGFFSPCIPLAEISKTLVRFPVCGLGNERHMGRRAGNF